MKTWKLISGILSMAFSPFILFQSFLAIAISHNVTDRSGSAGVLVALLLLVGGIVAVCVRNSKSNGGDISLAIIYGFAALCGFANQGVFTDLNIWSSFALLCLALAVISVIQKTRAKSNQVKDQID